MIRKDVFDASVMFEPGRIRSQDLDVWWRIGYRYPKIGYIAEPLAMMYLDEHAEALTERRVNEKRGRGIRELIARHLVLAAKMDALNDFKPYARHELKRRLRTMLFNGFGSDARDTVRDFSDLFPWWICQGVYVLTIFPGTTSTVMQWISSIKHALKLNRHVTRRYRRATVEKHTDEST